MINLAPIDKNIRTSLYKRSEALHRGDDVFGTQSENLKNVAKDAFSKSIWIRVFSPVNSTAVWVDTKIPILDKKTNEQKTDDSGNLMTYYKLTPGQKKGFDTYTIMGGSLTDHDSSGKTVKTNPDGFKNLYKPKDGFLRPIPGIKDITCNYKAGLAAIRETTINWVCWSFEDIELLSPHFLSHGKGVMVEWGWGNPTVTDARGQSQLSETPPVFNEEDMKDGTAYQSLRGRIIENSGNYDAMAGVISNWEWTLRDDGGFDCMTKIVSRGVNMLDVGTKNPGQGGVQIDPTDPEGKEIADKPSAPTLPEFCAAIKDVMYSLAVKGEDFWDFELAKALKPTPVGGTYQKDASQPPGVYVSITGNEGILALLSKKEAGPYMSWGFFEDNILSRFLGQIDSTGKTISSFRSLQPVLHPDGDGSFQDNSGRPTKKTTKAMFESTKIRNHNHLYSPYRDRWLLPGQFPAQNTATEEGTVLSLLSTEWDEKLTWDVSKTVQDKSLYPPFAVNSNAWNEGGYLRNILICYDLIEKAFENAKTLKEGVTALLDEINRDVDGFWNFKLTVDPYIDGNIKVIDMNYSQISVADLLEDRENKNNPESKLFTFNSWGEKSIVRSQSLKTKVPSAMAVTAMYAGGSKPGQEMAMGDDQGQAVGILGSQRGVTDQSQPDITMTWLYGSGLKGEPDGSAYGSKNPYGNKNNSQYHKSDNNSKTNVPTYNSNSQNDFGKDRGIEMNKLDMEKIIEAYKEEAEERSEEMEEAKNKIAAKSKDGIDNFSKVTSPLPHGRYDGKASKTMEVDWWASNKISLYDENGSMWNYGKGKFPALFRTTMLEIIHGHVPETNIDHRDKLDPLIPVEMEIVIDGIGGILPGNCWHVDYIPLRYQKYCVFQTLSVDHSVSSGEWTTTLKGQVRAAMKKMADEELGNR
tara:strand:+ start:4237 stop:6993 length:2757 start_codon:yes stop_codon:yes gene_type:complete